MFSGYDTYTARDIHRYRRAAPAHVSQRERDLMEEEYYYGDEEDGRFWTYR